ncbi:MAG: hypothetical protein QM778_24350 [Myxococcales bacterium]
MNPKGPIAVLAVLCALSTACHGASFETPNRFAKLAESERYEQRATNPQGVVVAVRKIDLAEPASLNFWSEAVTQRLQGGQGYALLGEKDVKAQTGHGGKLLYFGRDQNGHTFDYWVAVFPDHKRLYLLEAGGRRDRFDQAKAEIERAIASLRID